MGVKRWVASLGVGLLLLATGLMLLTSNRAALLLELSLQGLISRLLGWSVGSQTIDLTLLLLGLILSCWSAQRGFKPRWANSLAKALKASRT